MNYNQEAVKTIFGSKENLAQVVDGALHKIGHGVSFSEVMAQFLHHFENVASELVVTEVLGVDMVHFRVRTRRPMESSIVQYIIDDIEFKDMDKCVNHLFEEVRSVDYISAHKTYKFIFACQMVDEPELTDSGLSHYLKRVYEAKWSERAPVEFYRLGELAAKQKLKDKLEDELPAAAPKVNPPGCTRLVPTTPKLNKI